MGINYGRLRSLTPRKLISALTRDGFTLDRKVGSQQTGSHRHFIHPDGRRITVKFHHSGDIFHDPKIIKRMIEDQARWTEADLKRLDLIK